MTVKSTQVEDMLFEPEPQFQGLPREGFSLFAIPGHQVEKPQVDLPVDPLG